MDFQLDIISILLYLGAGQGFILSGFLSTHKRGNRNANRILAVILLFFSLSIVLHTAIHSGLIKNFKYHAEVVQMFFLLINPHLYLYSKEITNPNSDADKKDLYHVLPLIVGLVLLIILYSGAIVEERAFIIQHTISAIVLIQALYYVYHANKILALYSNRIKVSFSSLEKINLNWLRFMVIGFIFFMFVAFFIESFGQKAHEYWNYGWLVVSIFIYLIGYFGLKQPEIFSGVIDTKKFQVLKYEKSSLTAEMKKEYLDKLEDLMTTEQPYLQAGITLSGLAEKLNISAHHLSQVINQNYKQNFFDYINSKRIEEAKNRIMNPKYKSLNIAAICFDVGFNSTSAFNSAFKKHTGKTPSQYKNN